MWNIKKKTGSKYIKWKKPLDFNYRTEITKGEEAVEKEHGALESGRILALGA